MNRRELLVLLASSRLGWPAPAPAEQKPMPIVGFLSSASAEGFAPILPAFRGGLEEAGYVEGRNVAIEFAWAAGNLRIDRSRRQRRCFDTGVPASISGIFNGVYAARAR
jgi:hypothetical protein